MCKSDLFLTVSFLILNFLFQVKLNQGAEKIENKTHYGNKTLKEALTDLLNQAKLAQKFIEERGYQEIKNVAHSFTDDMSSLIDQYAHHVIDEVIENRLIV